MQRWTRSVSAKTGMEKQDFVKGLILALTDEKVIGALQTIVCRQLQNELSELKDVILKKDETINSLTKKVTQLETRCDDLEQYSRRNSLRIYSLPESTESSGEDISSKVLTLMNEQAHVTPPLTPEEVDRVHRIGPRPSSNRPGPRPVILKLATYRTRARIYSKRANLRNNPTQVYINKT